MKYSLILVPYIIIFNCTFLNGQENNKDKRVTNTTEFAEFICVHIQGTSKWFDYQELPKEKSIHIPKYNNKTINTYQSNRKLRHKGRTSIFKGTGKPGCKFIYIDDKGNHIQTRLNQSAHMFKLSDGTYVIPELKDLINKTETNESRKPRHNRNSIFKHRRRDSKRFIAKHGKNASPYKHSRSESKLGEF